MKPHFLKQLVSQLSEALPPHVSTFKKDFEKNCHDILSKTFAKFNLITRKEFDSQSKVLLRTRKKLEELESQLEKLGSLLKNKRQK